jgi:uncharacterized protein YegP (UPF0339 family)
MELPSADRSARKGRRPDEKIGPSEFTLQPSFAGAGPTGSANIIIRGDADMRVTIYRGHGSQPWRWQLTAANHKIIADSGEGYKTKRGATLAVSRLLAGVRGAVEIKVRPNP